MSGNDAEQPEMYGERIWLRPIEARDALVLSETTLEVDTEWAPRPNPPVSEIAFRNWIHSLEINHLVWAVCRTDQQEAIGTASLRNIDLFHRTAETGIGLLHPQDRGMGLGQEAMTLILDFAFDALGIHAVKCTIDARNVRSQRSVERTGYTLAGVLRADVSLGLGEYGDTLVYQLLASKWRAHR